MQYKSILYHWKFRVVFAIISAIVFKLLVDVIFGLIYRNYEVLKPLSSYLGVILMALIVVECFFWLAKKMDVSLSWNDKPKQRFFWQLSIHLLIMILFFGIGRLTIEYLSSDSYFAVIKDEIIIMVSIIIITLLFNLVELGLFLLFKWRFSLAEIERFKKENAEFHFEMLRNQINPHFLFNSLNTLSSLMYQNVDTAANYIRRLSQVYRYVLENRQKDLIVLEKEMQFIEAYKYLFELRFADKLTFNIEAYDEKKDYLIAPMTLQMLVENAVKHNVISSKNPLTISIICKDNFVSVSNNYQPKTLESYSSGMGLQNIQNQYAYLTDRLIEILNNDKEFRVKIPLLKSETN